MNEMVERVAAAMFCAEYGYDAHRWSDADEESEKFEYRRLARAAIAAMREPTQMMLEAMQGAGIYRLDHLRKRGDLVNDWERTIDAALVDTDPDLQHLERKPMT